MGESLAWEPGGGVFPPGGSVANVPSVPFSPASAPLRPRLTPLPHVCLTLNPSAEAAGRGIPVRANPEAEPQSPAAESAPPPSNLEAKGPYGQEPPPPKRAWGPSGVDRRGPLARSPLFPGSWEADSRSERRALPSVFSAAFTQVLYLDRLYLQYTCFRLVILEAGMETGQSRSLPVSLTFGRG